MSYRTCLDGRTSWVGVLTVFAADAVDRCFNGGVGGVYSFAEHTCNEEELTSE